METGGVQQYVSALLPALKARGHWVGAVLVSGQGRWMDRLEQASIPCWPLHLIARAGPGWKWPRPRALFHGAELIRRLRPDIVHTHLFLGNTVGRLAALWARVPVIVATEHSLYPQKRWPSKTLDRALARRTTGVMAVSQAVKDFTRRQEGLDPTRIAVHPPGLVVPPPPGLILQPPAVPILAMVGRLVPEKGHPLFLDVLTRLRKTMYPHATGWVLGDGPLRDTLRYAAYHRGLGPDAVRFLGHQDDVYDWIRHVSVVVLPSHREGFGLAALEAMAIGIPVVLSDIPAFRELTADGRYGTLVPLSGDHLIRMWSEAIRAVLEAPPDPTLVQNYVASCHTFGPHVDGLAQWYETLRKMRD